MPDTDAAVLARIEGAAIDGRLKVLRIRQRLFQSLHGALVQHRDVALEAIQTDNKCSLEEAQIVYGSTLIDLRNHYNALDFTTDLEQEYRLAKCKSNEGRRIPIAIAYIIPDSFTLFYSVFAALGAALEAGSCVVIEVRLPCCSYRSQRITTLLTCSAPTVREHSAKDPSSIATGH